MSTTDANATPEQRRPPDVAPIPEKPERADKESVGVTLIGNHPRGILVSLQTIWANAQVCFRLSASVSLLDPSMP
jgi:hypothetical protein